jgi:hypothetical protein
MPPLCDVSHVPRIVDNELYTYAYIKASTSIQVQQLALISFNYLSKFVVLPPLF